MTESPLVDSGFVVLVFSLGDDPIIYLNKVMAFLTVVASSRFPSTNNQFRTSSNPRNQATIQYGRVIVQQVYERQGKGYSSTSYKSNATSSGGNNASGQARTEDLDTYDSDCDDISNAKAVLMANISNYGSEVISEEKANKEHNNESVTAELERYKERVKTFKQCLNIDLSNYEKMIDSQMDDMIKEKLALKEQVDSLEQNLSKQIKEKECLLQTFTIFKNESKEKENKYMENEIDLEKKIKELDNIIYKVGQSAQTVHMLTKPQAFYDNIHKQALGYQNPFYLKKAQRIKPTLYDGIVISAKHVAMPVIDDEETLILEEESRSKMSEKEKDPEAIKQNISHKPIDYEKLNRLSDDFGKRFTPQQELSAEQAFWLRMSNPTSKPSDASPVKIEAPKELPKVSLVNESLKKLKFHLARFDNVVKIRTTPDARTEGEWGFEHTKAVFNNEIIPFLKSLKDIFNVFDKDLLNEIMEVHIVFDQMDAAVQRSSIDKQCLEIAKKELLLENDRLLQQIMSQDVLLTVMNSMSLIGESVNMVGMKKESCNKCFNLDVELLKSQNAFNDLLQSYSQLEKHCISLELSIQLNQEIFQKYESCNNQNSLKILEFFENNDLKTQLQDKDSTICKLKDIIKSIREKSKEENVKYDYCEIETKNLELENKNENLKAQIQDKVFVITSLKNDLRKVNGKEIVDISAQIPSANTIVPGMFKLDSEPLAPRSKPTCNKRNDRISRTPSGNMKNKVEAQPIKVNKKYHVIEPIRDMNVKHSLLNANSEPICVTCKKSMFDGVHDMCILDFVETVNSRAKSAKKHKKQNIWKPTRHVFTEVGFKWKPASRTFTIVGNLCPLTRLKSANVVPPKKTTSHLVETQKPELKVYSRKPKNVKNIRSNKKAKIVESKNANHSEPNHTWGSNATDIPSSSSLVMTGCPDCSLVSGLRMFKTHDREPLSALELLIVDDYSRFTWVRFMKTKDEAPEAIIKCIKNIQVCLNVTLRNVQTDNGTEFVNLTLREFYENVSISHQTSVARTPQQNGVVERRNRTLV
ncbi:integrase, catalytic region, zinc finger, CCHC-type containing protein [Tanacetum coccineum]|uniref:Integrase, catalytic region, zinc finger, CCHC-type containing protein n=1 Tax=Tanacetum coccineum TaxID=301880 RepID=A0ABQ5CH02_9ASTR